MDRGKIYSEAYLSGLRETHAAVQAMLTNTIAEDRAQIALRDARVAEQAAEINALKNPPPKPKNRR